MGAQGLVRVTWERSGHGRAGVTLVGLGGAKPGLTTALSAVTVKAPREVGGNWSSGSCTRGMASGTGAGHTQGPAPLLPFPASGQGSGLLTPPCLLPSAPMPFLHLFRAVGSWSWLEGLVPRRCHPGSHGVLRSFELGCLHIRLAVGCGTWGLECRN